MYIQIQIFRDVVGCELSPDSPQNIIRQIQAHVCTYTHLCGTEQTHLCGTEKSTILGRKDLFLKVIEYVPALILQICYRFYRFYGKSVSYPSMMSFMGNYTHNIYIHITSIYTLYTYT